MGKYRLSIAKIERVACMLLLISMLSAHAVADVHGNELADIDKLSAEWSAMPVDSLLKLGDTYATYPMRPDSALLCYSIAEVKEKSKSGNSGSKAIVEALMGKARILLYARQNYSEAYENLMRALEICENTPSLKKYKTLVISRLASVCHILYEVSKDPNMYEEAFSLHDQSMRIAYEEGDYLDYDLSYLNMLSLSFVAEDMARVEEASEYYDSHSDYQSDCTREYNTLLLRGLLALNSETPSDAVPYFKQQLDLLPPTGKYARYRYLSLACLSLAYDKAGNQDEAIKVANEAYQFCVDNKLTDGQLDAVRSLAQIWEAKGDSAKMSYWKEKELNLKSSLLTNSHSSGINNIHFQYALKKTTEQLQQSEREKRMLLTWIVLAVAVIIVVGIMLRAIYVSNVKLKEANRKLFEDFQAKLELYQSTQSEQRNVDRKPTVTDDEIDRLYSEIRQTVESTDKIFQSDFSLNSLSSMMEVSPTKISQAINRHDGVNFPSFVNKYRVIEACRKFQDREQYGNLTIETISQSVGFKSRAAFIAAFKKEAGLTPSEYLSEIKKAKSRDKEV